MTNELVVWRRDDALVTLTLNRPQVLNALNAALLDALEAALARVEQDPSIRVVILTGAGERAFAAGADIGELAALDGPAAGERLARRGQRLTSAIEQLRVPVVAAVNGYALGGGCELALACDVRIAAANATFGQPEVTLGLIPGYGGTQRTARLLGSGAALQLCLTGESIGADEALRLGLVSKVVPFAELAAEAERIAVSIARRAPLAVSAVKRAIRDGADLPLAAGLALEAVRFGALVASADFRTGTAAFLAKQRPEFEGR